MKKLIITLSIFFIVPSLFSQNVAINNTGADPDASAILDVSSSTKGVLIPRMTKSQRDAITPLTHATGLMIYQTDQSPGFYCYNGSSWEPVGADILAINDLVDGISDGSSVFLGKDSGINNDGSNNRNVGLGIETLKANTTGAYNTAVGYWALQKNSTGLYNTALGQSSLRDNSAGDSNIAIGHEALRVNNGSKNVAVGNQALNFTISGNENVGIGFHALRSAASFGDFSGNTGIGTYVMEGITGGQNTALGFNAMRSSNSATQNVAIGYEANKYNIQGDYNTIVGYQAGRGNTGTHSADYNVFLGYQAGINETNSNKLYIENSNSSTPLIGGDFSIDELYLNGKVGINTMSPLTQLQVDGNITFAPAGLTADESRFIGQSISSHTDFEASNGFGGIEVENFDRPGEDDSAQQLHFWTHHQGYESTRRMTIDTVGFVGIGTENPENVLEVARDGAVSNVISTTYRASGFSGGGFVGRGSRGSKEFPSALQSGDFLASFNARGYGSTGFSTLPRGRLAFIAAQNWTDTEQGSHMIFETVPLNTASDVERMRISSQGNVGIGTQTPGNRLDISNDSIGVQGLNVIQEGDANGATITINNPSSNAHTLNVYNSGNGYGLDLVIQSSGTGPGGRFSIDNTSNAAPAIYGEHNGLGNVGQFHASNIGNPQPAIFTQTQGTGPASEFHVNNVSSTAPGVKAIHKGLGNAGFFQNENATNTFSTIYARQDGMGNAGQFHALNFSNTSAALYAESTSMGSALGADNNGDGIAGYFNINGTTNDHTALEVKTLGTGSAAHFQVNNALNSDTVVVIEGNGSGPSIVANGIIDMAGFKMPTSPASGHVLTSDGSGVGSWQAPSFDFSDGGDVAGADRTLGNTDKYALSLITNNTERIKILYDGGIRLDGNLGIFTDPKAPGINKAIYLYDSDPFSNPYLKISGDNSGYIDLVSRRSATTSGRSYKVGSGGGAADVLDRFYIQSSIDGVVFTIRDGGNVGIGIDDPLEKLDVNGNIKSSGIIYGNGSGLTNISANDIIGTILASQIDSEIARDAEISSLETDPYVGSFSNNKIPRFNSSGILNAGSITDDGQNVSIGHSSPTSLLDLEASTGHGYEQLRLRTTYTPTSSSDTNGQVGDTAWDDNYFYIKTSTGWKRVALSTF